MSTRSTAIDAAITQAAAGQLGLVSAAQLTALGIGGATLEHRMHGGWLRRVVRGVYLVGASDLTAPMLDLAGVFYAGRCAVVGARAAAAAREFLPAQRGVTTIHRRGRRKPEIVRTNVPMVDGGFGLIKVLAGAYRPDEFGRIGPTPVALVPRMLVDLAAEDQDLFLKAWDGAEFRRALDVAALRRHLERGWRPGTAAVRAHLETFRELDLGDHGVDSPAELEAIRLVVAAGVPEPLVNHWIETPGGAKARRRLDLYFLLANLAIEIDGWEGHGSRSAFEDDRVRDSDLLARGIVTSRYSVARLRAEPRWCAGRILELVRDRTDQLAGTRTTASGLVLP